MTPTARITLREAVFVSLALLWFWGCAWTASKDLPAVADEIAHLTGGEFYWHYGVNHLQPENGYLAMHWSTLPWRLHPPVLPAVPADLPWGSAMIVIGHRFFYESGNDPAAMLAAGRAMMAIVGVAFVALIWWWARRLWGSAGGLLSVFLAAFCPTLLAHSGLVMSDVTLGFCLLLTVTTWWRLLDGVSIPRVLACGVSLGFLLLSKISGILVAPMLLALAVIRFLEREPLAWHLGRSRAGVRGIRKLLLLGGAGLATSLLAALVLWTAFGFHYSMFANPAAPAPQADGGWDMLLRDGGMTGHVVEVLRQHRLLPETWLDGLARTLHGFPGRLSFLNGKTYMGGTPAYFPYAWLVKTPLPLFGLMALGLVAALGSGRTPAETEALATGTSIRQRWHLAMPLLVLFVVYWAFALATPINIGHRHLLPVYGPMLILAGGAAVLWRQPSRLARGMVVLLAGWFAAESLWIRPNYLAYFNALAGGPTEGYRHLVDSNVDAGQDLIALRQWLDATAPSGGRKEPVFLSYFGPADPVTHGIHAIRFSDQGFDARPRVLPAPVRGGWFCVSVTLFQGLYTLTPGPWTKGEETLYRQLLEIATTRAPSAAEATTIEHLQFARLRLFLAERKPDARVGYSILIFHLSDAEMGQALYGPAAGI